MKSRDSVEILPIFEKIAYLTRKLNYCLKINHGKGEQS